MITYKTVLIILFALIINIFADNFSISNISALPTYEKYTFKATGTTLEETTVEMEYRLINGGTDSVSWEVKGSMPINGLIIEEEYLLRHRDLKILKSKRVQTFDRGTSEVLSTYDVDTKINESNTFLISTFTGLMYMLRTFPFESSTKELRVRMAQQSNKKIAIKVTNKGLVKVKDSMYGDVQAYETQVALSVPFIGAFLPKIRYFFRNDDGHTLIAMEGAFGLTGKKMNVKLIDHIKEM